MTTPVLRSNINQIKIPTQYHKLIEGKKKVCKNKIENIIEINDDSMMITMIITSFTIGMKTFNQQKKMNTYFLIQMDSLVVNTKE